jgi:hypothetical protein
MPTGGHYSKSADTELFLLSLQPGMFYLQASGGALRAAKYPAGSAEDAQNVISLGVGQRDGHGGCHTSRPGHSLKRRKRDLQ